MLIVFPPMHDNEYAHISAIDFIHVKQQWRTARGVKIFKRRLGKLMIYLVFREINQLLQSVWNSCPRNECGYDAKEKLYLIIILWIPLHNGPTVAGSSPVPTHNSVQQSQ